MKTLERPTKGHTPRIPTDFAAARRGHDLPVGQLIHDPTKSAGPTRRKHKSRQSVSFQKLLAELDRDELKTSETNLPAFPLDALPPPLRAWVEAIAQQTQTAPEAAALLALAATGAAIAGKMEIVGPNREFEPLNLYVGLLTGGDRCDEVMAAAIEPLRALEFAELAAADRERAAARIYRRDDRRTYEAASRAVDETTPSSSRDRIQEARVDIEMFEAAPAPRRVLDDVTARSLRYQLGQLGRIACFSPTGEVFRQIAGRSTASRQRLIETLDAGHAGRRFVVDGPRGKQTAVNRPAITLATLVDASLVAAIAGQRECHARSLLARFLFISPASRVGSRERLRAAAPELVAAYGERLRALSQIEVGILTPAPQAMAMLIRWERELEPQLGPHGSLAPIADWGKKLVATTLRLAGLLHAWASDECEVSEETLAAAIKLARWLVPQAAHALEKLGAADDDCTDHERALLRYARAAGVHGEFSPRDAWQHLRKTFLHTSALQRAFAQLVRRGYLQVAREGKQFPQRFALAVLSVALLPVEQVANLSRKKKKPSPQPQRLPAKNERTESTQPAGEVACSDDSPHPPVG